MDHGPINNSLFAREMVRGSWYVVHASGFQLVRPANGANGGKRIGRLAVGALVSKRPAKHFFAAARAAAHDNLAFLNFAAKLA
jgi:hypothetical protein